jgi:hypothetical protein
MEQGDPRFEWHGTNHAQRLASPASERTALLEFFFESVGGCLRMHIGYSSACHDGETVQQLGERYVQLATALATAVGMQRRSDDSEALADV